jgi:hypothetical protein
MARPRAWARGGPRADAEDRWEAEGVVRWARWRAVGEWARRRRGGAKEAEAREARGRARWARR